MARDLKTVITITKHLLRDNHLHIHGDPDLLPIPWNEKVLFLSVLVFMRIYIFLISIVSF